MAQLVLHPCAVTTICIMYGLIIKGSKSRDRYVRSKDPSFFPFLLR